MKTSERSVLLFVIASVMFAQQAITFDAVASPPPQDTLTFRTLVPDFEASDISGRTWHGADLRDKLTLVHVWSTGCIPCRQEQPLLQDFFYQTRTVKNIQVLTFALDDDPSKVQSYMKERGYTFPVIVNKDLEPKLFPAEGGIPKSFVVGPDGRRTDSFKSWTFGRILMEVEKLAKAK